MITVEIEHGYSLDSPILIEALPGECSTITDVQLECDWFHTKADWAG